MLTTNSGSCSLSTLGGAVTVTGAVFDLSGISGSQISAWVRKGADSFSEDPDNAGENLVLEFIDTTGFWITLETFDAGALAAGTIINVNTAIPFNGLHANAQLRVRQLGGSGGPPANGGLGWDFWHIDDIAVTETGTPPPIPNPDLTANSPTNSLFLRHGTASAISIALNTGGLQQITVYVQRGSDAFSENPEAGEDLVLEFLDSSNTWIGLETFPGDGAQGQIFNRTYAATPAMRHINFRLRLRLLTGSGSDFDYWHVDDLCLVSGAPSPTVTSSGDGVIDADTIDLKMT